jgi:hypothetical protein
VGHKVTERYLHSEVVYFDDDGNEVARERIHDDSLWDVGGPEELTDAERDDYLPREEQNDG